MSVSPYIMVLVTGEFNTAVDRIASMSDDFGFMATFVSALVRR